MLGAGRPEVVTVNVPRLPTVSVVLSALVIVGASFTVRVKFCVGDEPAVFVAVKVIAYVPPVPAAGVPLRVPVPLPLSTKLTPVGRGTPPRVMLALVGNPVVDTVKVPSVPTVNVVLLALVIVGASFTVRVKFCVGEDPDVFVAVNVIA